MAPAAALAAIWAVALFHGPTSDAHITDVNGTLGYADASAPRQDAVLGLRLRVPAAGARADVLAGLADAGSFASYDVSFAVVMLVAALAVMLLTAALAREKALTAPGSSRWRRSSPARSCARTSIYVPVALLLGALLALTRGARPSALRCSAWAR